MKGTGNLIRIVSIIILILLSVAIIGQHALSAESLAESKKDLKERIEEHEDTHASKAEKKDCSQCESFKDSQRSYQRNSYSIIISAVQSLLIYSVFCFILFGIGVLISKPIVKAAPVQQEVPTPQPQASAVAYCPKCGAQQQAGNYFCSVCGTPIQR